MNPYPSQYRKVRGGFSLFPTGQDQGVSGLGDLCLDASCQQTGMTNIDPITGIPFDVENQGAGVTSLASFFSNNTSLLLLLGAGLFLVVAMKPSR